MRLRIYRVFFFSKGPTQNSSKYGIGPSQQDNSTWWRDVEFNGFLLPEEPTSSAFLALSTSSTALTWSTMALLQTLSLPSWHDGLRFLRSSRVPFSRNFLRSLLIDLLEAGGRALPIPHVGAGHLIDQNETRQFRNKHLDKENKEKWLVDYLSAYSAVICARTVPCSFRSTRNVRCLTVHTLTIVINWI